MAQRDSRSSAYPGLAAFTDATQRQAIKLIYDKQQRIEQQIANLQTLVEAIPGGDVTVEAMRAYVLQQVATLRQQVPPPSYPVTEGIPGTPNTIPADAAPLYDGTAEVQAAFAANPGFIPTSCQAQGGTWDLMDAIVDTLRASDTNFAYNGKRGNPNDPSNDAVSYYYGSGAPTEGSTEVYVIDVISGHCGPNPQPAFNDVTVFAPGAWISRGRF